MMKDQLLWWSKGLLSAGVGAQGVVISPKSEELGLVEQVRLKELQMELSRLDLKEK